MDLTDEFDTRLQAMQRSRAPAREQDVAIAVYERLRTARAIATSLLAKPSNGDVLAVFASLNALDADRNFRPVLPAGRGSNTTDGTAS